MVCLSCGLNKIFTLEWDDRGSINLVWQPSRSSSLPTCNVISLLTCTYGPCCFYDKLCVPMMPLSFIGHGLGAKFCISPCHVNVYTKTLHDEIQSCVYIVFDSNVGKSKAPWIALWDQTPSKFLSFHPNINILWLALIPISCNCLQIKYKVGLGVTKSIYHTQYVSTSLTCLPHWQTL